MVKNNWNAGIDIVGEIMAALENVKDPEIPRLSIVDLGIVTSVNIGEDYTAEIEITPTFAGCPAIRVIQDNIKEEIMKLSFLSVNVKVSYDRQWSSDMISDKGRQALKESGFAPPVKHYGIVNIDILKNVACPQCDGNNTRLQSPFGPALCRSIHYCDDCMQAFEQFKPV